MLFYWIATQFLSGAFSVGAAGTGEVGGVAYFAHIGGFVAGYLAAKILPTKEKQPELLEEA